LQIELAEEKSQSVHSGNSPLLAQQMYKRKKSLFWMSQKCFAYRPEISSKLWQT